MILFLPVEQQFASHLVIHSLLISALLQTAKAPIRSNITKAQEEFWAIAVLFYLLHQARSSVALVNRLAEECLLRRIANMQLFLSAAFSLARRIMVEEWVFFLALLRLSLPVVSSAALLMQLEVDCIMIAKLLAFLLHLTYYLQKIQQIIMAIAAEEVLKTVEIVTIPSQFLSFFSMITKHQVE